MKREENTVFMHFKKPSVVCEPWLHLFLLVYLFSVHIDNVILITMQWNRNVLKVISSCRQSEIFMPLEWKERWCRQSQRSRVCGDRAEAKSWGKDQCSLRSDSPLKHPALCTTFINAISSFQLWKWPLSIYQVLVFSLLGSPKCLFLLWE